jgi:hypothetical protein
MLTTHSQRLELPTEQDILTTHHGEWGCQQNRTDTDNTFIESGAANRPGQILTTYSQRLELPTEQDRY